MALGDTSPKSTKGPVWAQLSQIEPLAIMR